MNKINRNLQKILTSITTGFCPCQDFNQNNVCKGIYDFQKSGCLLLCKGPGYQTNGTESVTLAPSMKCLETSL